MESPIINRTTLRAVGGKFQFHLNLERRYSNQTVLNMARRHTPRSVASDPILHCLPVEHDLNGLILFFIGQTLALPSLGMSLSTNSVINVAIVIRVCHEKKL